MPYDSPTETLFQELSRVPLIDPHSHIDPLRPAARSLDDILGYHYYTELAHSAGMSQDPLRPEVPPRERVRAILEHMDRFDNTAQYRWFVEIARTFLGFEGDRVTAADADWLCDTAERTFARSDWADEVFRRTNLEKIFLTNEFDDSLEGFDTSRYVPCLRTDALVFQLSQPAVRQRFAKASGIEVGDADSLRRAVRRLFEHFTGKGAKACAISLPPDFAPFPVPGPDLTWALQAADQDAPFTRGLYGAVQAVRGFLGTPNPGASPNAALASGTFWLLAECCREFGLPFDLMIGVNRGVYAGGVHQGRDLFDQRTSLVQYRELFNAFPEVTFPVSVLSSGQNQELVSHAWIFPNVATNGHWWYSNVPAYIEPDLRARLQAVPRVKQIGYYSDAYKLEFVKPKYDMYRRCLAKVLADEFVKPGLLTESRAVELGRALLRENVERIFKV